MSENKELVAIIDHGEGDEPQINLSPNRTFAAVLEARLRVSHLSREVQRMACCYSITGVSRH